ncbi:MAG TPA: hypothetical protein GX707_06540 [Epulopiscium sp.]|nr:hypothetical protein [Candidatus Epulonipiscium sp.]
MEEHIEKSEISYRIEKEKGAFIKWVKAHKKELFLAGISIASLIGIIVGIKNKDSINKLWTVLQKTVSRMPADKVATKVTENSISVVETVSASDIILLPAHNEYRAIFDVKGHIRNLYEGWNTSPEKMAAAAEHGIELLPGQTWVESYTKGVIAA